MGVLRHVLIVDFMRARLEGEDDARSSAGANESTERRAFVKKLFRVNGPEDSWHSCRW